MTFTDTGVPVIYFATYMVTNFEGEKQSLHFRGSCQLNRNYLREKQLQTISLNISGQIMVELIQKNSCTPRDHICGQKFSCRKEFLSCMHPPFLMNNSMSVILN